TSTPQPSRSEHRAREPQKGVVVGDATARAATGPSVTRHAAEGVGIERWVKARVPGLGSRGRLCENRAPGVYRGPSSTAVTLKFASSFTVTMLPSDWVMWASYLAPSASVSTRCT